MFQYFVEQKHSVRLSPDLDAQIPLASSAGIAASRGSASGPGGVQSS